MRVCLLVRENVMHWAPFYIEAFRACCDTITIGPALDEAEIARQGFPGLIPTCLRNDIVTDTDDVCEALAQLPDGWRPDLVVAIQSRAPAYRHIPRLACPSVYISVDTWHAPEEFKFARNYDFVVAAQRVFPPYFVQTGSPRARWLPLGCSEQQHHPVDTEPLYDIVFVGCTRYRVNRQRVARLFRLAEHFHVARQEGIGTEAMCTVFSEGRVVFNSSIAQDVNMRVFEALAMGQPLLTNRDAAANGLFDLFEDGVHLQSYDEEDLLEQAQRLLADPDRRRALGEAGRAEVLAKHTYTHRVRALLENLVETDPQLGQRNGPLWREGEQAAAYLPYGARHVLDIGLHMERSRVALRRVGVRRFDGVALSAEAAAGRQRRYDTVHLWPAEGLAPGAFDVLVWSAPGDCGIALAEIMARAHALLPDGGTLIFRMDAREVGETGQPFTREFWDDWLYAHGFHLMLLRPAGPKETWSLLVARRYSRTVYDVSEEIYRRFPGGGEVELE